MDAEPFVRRKQVYVDHYYHRSRGRSGWVAMLAVFGVVTAAVLVALWVLVP